MVAETAEQGLGARVGDLAEALRSRPRVWSSSVADLGRYRLASPIVVRVEEIDGECVASWPEVEAYGSGASEADAINELKDQISALFEELNNEPDDALGELPLRWRDALRSVLRPRS